MPRAFFFGSGGNIFYHESADDLDQFIDNINDQDQNQKWNDLIKGNTIDIEYVVSQPSNSFRCQLGQSSRDDHDYNDDQESQFLSII